ncbi:hypothetical protein ACFEMC_05560 [Kineococcus sp. DHX-1]|uniref:hypothetical protein n=1 Tax=Kineococcus sp. DHX-1 TaxID=3349638 RepID=UPI0036D3FB65
MGILLCTGGDEQLVRYALGSSTSPMAVASYDALSAEQRAGLPDLAQLQAVVNETLIGQGAHPFDGSPSDRNCAPTDTATGTSNREQVLTSSRQAGAATGSAAVSRRGARWRRQVKEHYGSALRPMQGDLHRRRQSLAVRRPWRTDEQI